MQRDIHQALGRYLSIRARSEGEVRSYLKQKSTLYKLDETKREELVHHYTELGFINDELFVEAVVHGALSRGKGQTFIRQKLTQAGVNKELITKAISDPSAEDLYTAMEKRLRKYEKKLSELEPRLRRQKAYNALFASGFSGKDIAPFIDLWMQKE